MARRKSDKPAKNAKSEQTTQADGWCQIPGDTPLEEVVAQMTEASTPAKQRKSRKAKPKKTTKSKANAQAKPKVKAASPEPEKSKAGKGRPTAYTKEIAAEICERMSNGETLISICKSEHIPARSTVNRWIDEDRDGFSGHYARAREALADYWADEQIEIADDANNDWMERHDKDGNSIGWTVNGEHIQRSRARLETRRWLMEKANPRKYGPKVEVDTPPDGNIAKAVTVTMAALASLAERRA